MNNWSDEPFHTLALTSMEFNASSCLPAELPKIAQFQMALRVVTKSGITEDCQSARNKQLLGHLGDPKRSHSWSLPWLSKTSNRHGRFTIDSYCDTKRLALVTKMIVKLLSQLSVQSAYHPRPISIANLHTLPLYVMATLEWDFRRSTAWLNGTADPSVLPLYLANI